MSECVLTKDASVSGLRGGPSIEEPQKGWVCQRAVLANVLFF